MSLKKPAKNQPENFEFTHSSIEAAKNIIAKYPKEKKKKCCNGITLYSPETK